MGWLDDLAGVVAKVVAPVTRTLTPMRLEVLGEGPSEPGRFQALGLRLENRGADATFRVQIVECGGLRIASNQPPWAVQEFQLIKRGFILVPLVQTPGMGPDEYPRFISIPTAQNYSLAVPFAGVSDPEHCDPTELMGKEAFLRVRIWNRTIRKQHDWIMRFGVGDDYRLWRSLSRV